MGQTLGRVASPTAQQLRSRSCSEKYVAALAKNSCPIWIFIGSGAARGAA
jgi:hypothetical protein